MKKIPFFGLLSAFVALCMPVAAQAHEVYVLTNGEIASGLATPAFSLWDVLVNNLDDFLLWAFLGILVVFCVFFISISRYLEKKLDPLFLKVKPYASMIARVTVGISFLAAAYYQATYGPELPIAASYGAFAPVLTVLLVLMGISLCTGIFVRASAILALCLFAFSVYKHGSYMLTYTNYLGEILVLVLFGIEAGGGGKKKGWFSRLANALRPYHFLILRVAFGISLLYAALYAKVFHNYLALQVATLTLGHMHNIAYYFGMEPHFLVLGTAVVEILISIFFIFGIEIRFTALFLEFWLSLSLLYFGEIVWPHLILIGIPIAFFFYGYDKYSLEGFFFKKGAREPVL